MHITNSEYYESMRNDIEELKELTLKFIEKHEDSIKKYDERISKLETKKRFLFGSVVASLSILLLIVLSVFILNNYFTFDKLGKPFLGWFLVSIAILLMALFSFISLLSNIKKLSDSINKNHEIGLNSILENIRDNLTPTVYAHSTVSDVALTATQILESAINEEKEKNRYVYYFGALNLSVLEYEESYEDAEEDNKILKEYKNAQNNLNSYDIKIYRYINLISPEEYLTRSEEIRENYKRWLSNQLANYSTTNYKILKAKRAPSWADTNSYIITYRSYLHITGFGEAAIHVSSPELVKKIREKIIDIISSARNEINKPKYMTQTSLNEYYQEILKADKNKL